LVKKDYKAKTMKTLNPITMRRISLLLLYCALVITALSSCKKSGGDDTGGGTTEETLSVEISPAGPVEAAAPGPDFPLKVTLKSKMPSSGIKIDVLAKPDAGGAAYFTTSKTTSSAVSDFIITGTPSGVICTVQVTVVSVIKPTNMWSTSYKYSKK
jgi:hypothetical protein